MVYRHYVVVRFLAGICGDNEDYGHCYQELVQLLDHLIDVAEFMVIRHCSSIYNAGLLLLFHCVYECPSIM